MSMGLPEGMPERNSSEWVCCFLWIEQGAQVSVLTSLFYNQNRT